MAGADEHGSKLSSSIKDGKYVVYLMNYCQLKKNFIPWNLLYTGYCVIGALKAQIFFALILGISNFYLCVNIGANDKFYSKCIFKDTIYFN